MRLSSHSFFDILKQKIGKLYIWSNIDKTLHNTKSKLEFKGVQVSVGNVKRYISKNIKLEVTKWILL